MYIIIFLLLLPYNYNDSIMEVRKILERIIKKRKKKGYSYENMAEELALSPSGYRKIETGETKLLVERMFQIATVLDIPIKKLLDIEEPEKNENKEVLKKLIASYENLLKEKEEQIASLKENIKKR